MKWSSVDQSLPNEGETVAVYDGNFHVAIYRPSQSLLHYRWDCNTYCVSPTHWMRLSYP